MVQGITHNQKTIDKIVQDYKTTGSIYQAAKKNKVHYNTAKKYIYNNKPIDKRNLLPATRQTFTPLTSNNSLYNNIYIKDKNIPNTGDKDRSIEKDTNTVLSANKKYIKTIDTILSKLLTRIKREYADIPIKDLYKTTGVLFDKRSSLTGDNAAPDSQVIINFYGDKDKVNEMLRKIKDSKRIYDKSNA